MNILNMIRNKKAGQPICTEDMDWLVRNVTAKAIPDYQLATLLTVICYEGLNREETLAMTKAFVASGDTLSWETIARPVVDKHSTGGVGDKVTLALAPLLACAGLAMPKMSGRGLGHTGGTIDKLESIPGFRTDLSTEEFHDVLSRVGCAVAGQTAALVPADKIFYGLRDATDNVREMGLVAASVLCKKLAAGAPHIVLDVKCGNGAFFIDEQQARQFSELAMSIGRGFDRKLACVITDMEQPLGRAVGNRLEVLEVLDLLNGRQGLTDLREVVLTIAAVELVITGLAINPSDARNTLEELLEQRTVLSKFEEWIEAQGGNLGELETDPQKLTDVQRIPGTASDAGVIADIDCLAIGNVARKCGAGRLSKDDRIHPNAGLVCNVAIGDEIQQGQELAMLYLADSMTDTAVEILNEAQASFAIEETAIISPRNPIIDILLP